MIKNPLHKKTPEFIDRLVDFFKKMPNPKKKGDLSEMILRDDFHNKNQTEDDYQKEQIEWLNKINKKKTDGK